jgi:hypothetical protein
MLSDVLAVKARIRHLLRYAAESFFRGTVPFCNPADASSQQVQPLQ